MSRTLSAAGRWSLADLIDFEALLAAEAGDASDRLYFARDIAPRLPAGDELARRRVGLKLWLESRRAHQSVNSGALWNSGLTALRLTLFAVMVIVGFMLVAGLCAGNAQSVHVVVFFALTLVLPWVVFVLWPLARLASRRRTASLERAVALVMRLAGRTHDGLSSAALADWRQRLGESARSRRALAAAFAGVLQWGGLGFALGLVLAFAGSLLVFDVRFYWEATPQTGALVETAAKTVAAPWGWAWPAAVPDTAAIAASRARYVDGVKQVPGDAAAGVAWWRFLLMSLLVWGVLPRLLLIGLARWRLERALAALDFQAPRHRALWRRLAAVERGAVAPAAADGALVLNVGGLALESGDLRGFLLRALRVNPQAEHRVDVLDETEETAADAALAERPDQVVLLVEDWGLSPRQAARLHARVRDAIGARTPMTWVVLAVVDGAPVVPGAAHLARWTKFIDGLRDPATEIVAYAPGV